MIQNLVSKIKKANIAYRTGNSIISDKEYDILLDELMLLDPDNNIFNEIGIKIEDESRKRKIPIPMFSMNKLKTISELYDWAKSKRIQPNIELVITPKYDGLSLCVNELTNEAWTRGDGEYGQKSDEHYELIKNKLLKNDDLPFEYSFGEVMMSKNIFINKYANDFVNPRNLVSGLLNSKEINNSLNDLVYIKYGCNTSSINLKSGILDYLNSNQEIKVPYKIINLDTITDDLMIDLFNQWSSEFEIDGLILEINSIEIQNQLGRETSTNNPCWARAYKSPMFEKTADVDVTGITWNISKQGYLKPTIHITPTKLDGVTISNVTGNNARFVKDLGIGIGSVVKIVRSGMVIPKIIDVIKPVEFILPTIPNIKWNDNGVELVTIGETDEQKFKQLVSFFEILDTKNLGEGVIKQLWDSGFKTVKDILNLSIDDLEKVDRFGNRKASIIFNSIKKSTNNVSLSKLQHATGIFKGLGSRKLALLEHFDKKPSIDDIMRIDGFAEISAISYINGYDEFFNFIKELPITIIEKVKEGKISNDLEGLSFIFTGVRRPDLVKVIESRGGKECSSVSKNTTHLVCADKNSTSSKMKKAIDLGIEILDVDDLENFLK